MNRFVTAMLIDHTAVSAIKSGGYMKKILVMAAVLCVAILSLGSAHPADADETYFVFPNNNNQAQAVSCVVHTDNDQHTYKCETAVKAHSNPAGSNDAAASVEDCSCNADDQATAMAVASVDEQTEIVNESVDEMDQGTDGETGEVPPTPSAIDVFGEKTLRRTKNEYVMQLQKHLNQYYSAQEDSGFIALTEDGVFTRSTENAVKRFQEEQGLEADGRVGADTKQRLLEAVHSGE